jgi:hypothetical protein
MPKPGKSEKWAARGERLAGKLRENLKRRKAQARGRERPPAEEADRALSPDKVEGDGSPEFRRNPVRE